MAFTLPTWLVSVNQRHNGQPLANVVCVQQSSGSEYDELTVAQLIATHWTDSGSFVDCQVVDLEYVSLDVRRLDTGGETVVADWAGTGAPITGAVVGDPVDPGSCLGFTLRTGLGGKSNRGRIYIGCVGRLGLDGFSTSWDLSSSPGSTFKTCADNFLGGLSGDNLLWSVFSRKLDQPRAITTTQCRSSVLSQNPRARRYGVV